MYFYLKFSKFKTGEYCPASGIWQTVDSKDLLALSKGEIFPPFAGEIARWEHKKSFEPDPAELQKLKDVKLEMLG